MCAHLEIPLFVCVYTGTRLTRLCRWSLTQSLYAAAWVGGCSLAYFPRRGKSNISARSCPGPGPDHGLLQNGFSNPLHSPFLYSGPLVQFHSLIKLINSFQWWMIILFLASYYHVDLVSFNYFLVLEVFSDHAIKNEVCDNK